MLISGVIGGGQSLSGEYDVCESTLFVRYCYMLEEEVVLLVR